MRRGINKIRNEYEKRRNNYSDENERIHSHTFNIHTDSKKQKRRWKRRGGERENKEKYEPRRMNKKKLYQINRPWHHFYVESEMKICNFGVLSITFNRCARVWVKRMSCERLWVTHTAIHFVLLLLLLLLGILSMALCYARQPLYGFLSFASAAFRLAFVATIHKLARILAHTHRQMIEKYTK